MQTAYQRLRQLGRKLPHPVRKGVVDTYRQVRQGAGRAKRSAAGQKVFAAYREVTSPHHASSFDQLSGALPLSLGSKTSWHRVRLEPYMRYLLQVTTSEHFDPTSNAAAVQYRYLDNRGRLVQSGAVNKPDSPDLGYFDFVPRVPAGNTSDYVFYSPGEAEFVDIGFRTWKADGEVVLSDVTITELGPRTAVRTYDLGKRATPRNPLRVALIADTFTGTALSYECDVLMLTQANYEEEINGFAPDLVFVESAWDGNDGEWLYCIHQVKPEDQRLRGLLAYARERSIPTLFWNKEDPAHFEDFIGAASLCDVVATTDASLIPRYTSELGHDRVFSMPFCVQPDIHNPRRPYDERKPRIEAACFLGSWWAEKFGARRDAQVALFEGSQGYGLEIFDRYFTWHTHERYRIPQPWLQYVHGTLNYDQAISAYRMYDVVLNVNTITDSPTMFSRRALEAAACGAGVITNPSAGTDAAFGGLIDTAATAAECSAALESFRTDRRSSNRRVHLAYRKVHQEHSWANRLSDLTEHCGIVLAPRRDPHISVVLATMRPEGAKQILSWLGSVEQRGFSLSAQVVTAFDPAEIEQAAAEHFPAANLHRQAEHETLGDCLNWGIDNSSADYVAKVDDDDHYGPNYFADLLLAARFSRADVVGKQCHFEWFESRDATMLRYPDAEHRFTTFVCGSTLLIKSDVFEQVRFPRRRVGEDTIFLNRVTALGMRTYSADRFNYVSMRWSDLSLHTWQATEEELLSGSETLHYADGIAKEELNL